MVKKKCIDMSWRFLLRPSAFAVTKTQVEMPKYTIIYHSFAFSTNYMPPLEVVISEHTPTQNE